MPGGRGLASSCRSSSTPPSSAPARISTAIPDRSKHDLRQCEAAGADLVFAPSVPTIYPHGSVFDICRGAGLSDILEGASRPGHFRGVATVVLKLFEIVRPDLAVFGQKDYQQQLVIRRMVEDLHRARRAEHRPDRPRAGRLALSSRNRYLNPQRAPGRAVLYRASNAPKMPWPAASGEADRVRQILRETIESEPLVKLDYAEVADAETLEPLGDLA